MLYERWWCVGLDTEYIDFNRTLLDVENVRNETIERKSETSDQDRLFV